MKFFQFENTQTLKKVSFLKNLNLLNNKTMKKIIYLAMLLRTVEINVFKQLNKDEFMILNLQILKIMRT